MEAPSESSRFIGRIVDVGEPSRVLPLFEEPKESIPAVSGQASFAAHGVGAIALFERAAGGAAFIELLAEPSTARADLYGVLEQAGLDPLFPAEVIAETERLRRAPGIDDPRLVDATHLPFVTIDAPTSRDLDQALFIERVAPPGDGYTVHYALADAAHFVPPRSAIFREALRRAASYYLPGLSVPMLPRELCEGIVSLNEGVDRRALVFSMTLGPAGERRSTEVTRARVRSRKKLSFGEVEAFYTKPDASALAGTEIGRSLELLREVGQLLMRESMARHVVRYARREVDVSLSPSGGSFVVSLERRGDTELYNEQVSLLCNAEGARILLEGASPDIQAIFRVHPAPDEAKLTGFAELTGAVARSHGLDVGTWVFRSESTAETLSDYLARLPTDPPGTEPLAPEHRVARALQRQAILVNVRSTFAASPAKHFGVGAEVYARFSAPMRELVGVFVHKEIVELEGSRGGRVAAPEATAREIDEALRVEVVGAANRAKETQRRVNDLSNRVVIDRILRADLETSLAERPRRSGTVMGITSSKVHVALDMPAIDVKLYVRDLGRARGGAWLEARGDGVELFDTRAGASLLRLGDRVAVFVERHDDTQDRWVLAVDSTVAGG